MRYQDLDHRVLTMSMAGSMLEAASYMRQAITLEKEISAIEEKNSSDGALAFKYLQLGHLQDMLAEHHLASQHYERAAELYLIHNKHSVASSAYFSAGKALYLAKEPARQFKALVFLNLAKTLDQASGNKNQNEHPERQQAIETLTEKITASLKNQNQP